MNTTNNSMNKRRNLLFESSEPSIRNLSDAPEPPHDLLNIVDVMNSRGGVSPANNNTISISSSSSTATNNNNINGNTMILSSPSAPPSLLSSAVTLSPTSPSSPSLSSRGGRSVFRRRLRSSSVGSEKDMGSVETTKEKKQMQRQSIPKTIPPPPPLISDDGDEDNDDEIELNGDEDVIVEPEVSPQSTSSSIAAAIVKAVHGGTMWLTGGVVGGGEKEDESKEESEEDLFGSLEEEEEKNDVILPPPSPSTTSTLVDQESFPNEYSENGQDKKKKTRTVRWHDERLVVENVISRHSTMVSPPHVLGDSETFDDDQISESHDDDAIAMLGTFSQEYYDRMEEGSLEGLDFSPSPRSRGPGGGSGGVGGDMVEESPRTRRGSGSNKRRKKRLSSAAPQLSSQLTSTQPPPPPPPPPLPPPPPPPSPSHSIHQPISPSQSFDEIHSLSSSSSERRDLFTRSSSSSSFFVSHLQSLVGSTSSAKMKSRGSSSSFEQKPYQKQRSSSFSIGSMRWSSGGRAYHGSEDDGFDGRNMGDAAAIALGISELDDEDDEEEDDDVVASPKKDKVVVGQQYRKYVRSSRVVASPPTGNSNGEKVTSTTVTTSSSSSVDGTTATVVVDDEKPRRQGGEESSRNSPTTNTDSVPTYIFLFGRPIIPMPKFLSIQKPEWRQISNHVVRKAPCFWWCCAHPLDASATDRAILSRLNILCAFFAICQVGVGLFLFVVQTAKNNGEDGKKGRVNPDVGVAPSTWTLNGMMYGMVLVGLILFLTMICTLRVVREVNLIGAIRYMWVLYWTLPLVIFFSISLFDYHRVTTVWIKHWWSTSSMAWFRNSYCLSGTADTLCAVPEGGGTEFMSENDWCRFHYDSEDCSGIRDDAQLSMQTTAYIFFTCNAVWGLCLVVLLLLALTMLEAIITSPIVQASKESNIPLWLTFPTAGCITVGFILIYSPSSALSRDVWPQNNWIGRAYLSSGIAFAVSAMLGWSISAFPVLNSRDKRQKQIAVSLFLGVMFLTFFCVMAIFVASLIYSADLVKGDLAENERGKAACRIDTAGSCSNCEGYPDYDDSKRVCPEWTKGEVLKVMQTQLKQSATLAAIFFIYAFGSFRFGFTLRAHIELYEIEYV